MRPGVGYMNGICPTGGVGARGLLLRVTWHGLQACREPPGTIRKREKCQVSDVTDFGTRGFVCIGREGERGRRIAVVRDFN